MRKTMYRYFSIWGFDKEERWLNEMAAKGLALVDASLCKYTFEETQPGEYGLRLELLENVPGHVESQHYIRFVEESGAEYLGSVNRWVYFRKPKAQGSFELYSDYASRLAHMKRISVLSLVLVAILLFFALSNLTLYFTIHQLPVNLWIGSFLLGLALLFCLGSWKIHRIKGRLKREHQLFE